MQKKLLHIQAEMNAILKEELDPSVKVTKLEALVKEVKNAFGINTSTTYDAIATLYEAMGDVWMRANQVVNAEKAFRTMLANSKMLYDLNPEKLDYRYGFSCYKLASFYTTILGCNKLSETPKELDDTQKQVFLTADSLFKMAISSTMRNAKTGLLQYAQLQAMAMSELSLLHAAIGEYKMAAGFGVDGVNVTKSVYTVLQTREYLYTLINRINHQATIYNILKEDDKKLACLEESIHYAKAKLEEAPVDLGLMIGKCYMNIGACLDEQKAVLKADAAYEKGLEAIAQAHKASQYTLLDEVIKGYMKVGYHYQGSGRADIAKSYFAIAYEKASLAYDESEAIVYKNLMEQLAEILQLH